MSFGCFTIVCGRLGELAMAGSTDDGGGDSWEREVSQQYFEDFVVVLLRSIASGDYPYRVTEQFFRFLKHAEESRVPIGPVFQGAIRALHERAFPDTEAVVEKTHITLTALRLIAERTSNDGLARARQSGRDRELSSAIEQYILDSEERSRANGWSYVTNLTKHLKKRPKNDPPVHL
jgi:hypothetical protein